VIIGRMSELYTNSEMTDEVALMVAAKEMHTTEKEILKTLGAIRAADVRGLLTGRQSVLGVLFHGIEDAIKRAFL